MYVNFSLGPIVSSIEHPCQHTQRREEGECGNNEFTVEREIRFVRAHADAQRGGYRALRWTWNARMRRSGRLFMFILQA